ncbi:MAG: ABC transporter substrate-binding protein [Pseudomonadota bacterium]
MCKLACLFVCTSASANELRIGFVTTLSTGAKVVGEDLRDGFLLGLDEIGGRIANFDVKPIIVDDKFSPAVGKQVTQKLLTEHDVHLVTGFIWSNVLLASKDLVLDAGRVLISANAGPSKLAGKECHPNFFNVSFQNGQLPAAIGKIMRARGYSRAYIMVPDYAAGRDMAAGFARGFSGEVVGRTATRWTPTPETNFIPVIAKAADAGSDLVFAFYPGKPGVKFFQQFKRTGSVGQIAVATSFTIDALLLRGVKKSAEGVWGALTAVHWAPNLENPRNQDFVRKFRTRFKRMPSFYAAQGFDVVSLIQAAVLNAGGDTIDIKKLRDSLKRVTWPSVRGAVSFGTNNFLRQNLYLGTVVSGRDGPEMKALEVIERQSVDDYASSCAFDD